MPKAKTLTGYKGFDKDLKCRDKQYVIGKSYTHRGTVKLCEGGLHFVEHPLDAFSYYPILYTENGELVKSRYASVEATGVSDETSNDSKRVARSLKINAELSLKNLVDASVKFVLEKSSKPTSGDDAHSATSGNYAHSATSGNRAHSATSGYGAHSATSGVDNAIACAIGRKAKAKASKGCFIVLAEWYEGRDWTDARPIAVKSAQVDGKKIKADQWYKLVDGEFVETDGSNE